MGAIQQWLCELLLSCSLVATPAPAVDDLTYGTVLYDHFQSDSEAALLKTMVAQTRGYASDDAVRFDLAMGSFAFAEGMHDLAMSSFSRVADHELESIDHMRLAFHLAREYYRRQDWSALQPQLVSLRDGLTTMQRQHPEVTFMDAELATYQGNYQHAFGMLSGLEGDPALRGYGFFNLGVSLKQADQTEMARTSFAAVANATAVDAQTHDLQQRAKLALAYMARESDDVQSAQAVLQALPADGRYQTVAMAAFGRLAMEREDHELAARIWMSLQQEDDWAAGNASARLGLPLALHGLADAGKSDLQLALQQYRQAKTSFETRLVSLQGFSRMVSDPLTMQDALTVLARDEMRDQLDDELSDSEQSWQQRFAEPEWAAWLAREEVHELIGQWRELNGMQDWLGDLPIQVEALQEVASERERRIGAANTLLVDDGLLARRESLHNQVIKLADQLEQLRNQQAEPTAAWMNPLVDADETAMFTRIQNMQALVANMPEHDQQKWSARLDRLHGLLFYRLASERAKRIQQLAQRHSLLTEELAQLDESVARVAAAERAFDQGAKSDLASFVGRAEQITTHVDQAKGRRELALSQAIERRVEGERSRIERLLMATRVAIARATDQLASVQIDQPIDDQQHAQGDS